MQPILHQWFNCCIPLGVVDSVQPANSEERGFHWFAGITYLIESADTQVIAVAQSGRVVDRHHFAGFTGACQAVVAGKSRHQLIAEVEQPARKSYGFC